MSSHPLFPLFSLFPLFWWKIHFFHSFHFFIHFFQYFLIFWKINNNFRKKDIYFEFYGCLLDWLKSFYSQFSFSIDQTFSNLSPYLLQIVYSYFILLFWLHKFINKYTFLLKWFRNFNFLILVSAFFVILVSLPQLSTMIEIPNSINLDFENY